MSLRQTIGRTLALKAVVLSIPFEVAVERRRVEVVGHFKAIKHIPPRREGLGRDGVASANPQRTPPCRRLNIPTPRSMRPPSPLVVASEMQSFPPKPLDILSIHIRDQRAFLMQDAREFVFVTTFDLPRIRVGFGYLDIELHLGPRTVWPVLYQTPPNPAEALSTAKVVRLDFGVG